MPKVARNYQREDFSDLLVQMQHPAAEPESESLPREPKKENRAAQVSPERRRRDRLMSIRAMRYAYSSVEKRLHDRDCAEVSKIPDTEFEMLTEYRTDLKRCWLCGHRAIVRAGISCDRFGRRLYISNESSISFLTTNLSASSQYACSQICIPTFYQMHCIICQYWGLRSL